MKHTNVTVITSPLWCATTLIWCYAGASILARRNTNSYTKTEFHLIIAVLLVNIHYVLCYFLHIGSQSTFHWGMSIGLRQRTVPVVDLEGVPWVPWNPPFCRQLEDQPAHGTVFSRNISGLILKRSVSMSYSSF